MIFLQVVLIHYFRDPSGSDRFRTVITKYFHNATGIMFVYDVNYAKSFQSVKEWIMEIQEHPDLGIKKLKLFNAH